MEASKSPLRRELGLGCLGFSAGGLLGASLGIWSGYGIAALSTPNAEKQAYMLLLIVPAIALIGAYSLALTLSALPRRSWKRVLATIPGWLVLLFALILGMRFHAVERPATLRLRNETTFPLEQVYVGLDFRRSTRLGQIPPGSSTTTSIDLARRGTFGRISGHWQGKGFTLWDPDTRQETGDLTYVVTHDGTKLRLEILRR